MQKEIELRLNELVEQGANIVDNIGNPKDYYVTKNFIECQSWILSCANMVEQITNNTSFYRQEVQKLMSHEYMNNTIPKDIARKMHGLILSLAEEFKKGFLRNIEYIVAAETFDDFLDQADKYHQGNKITESSILASAVLEDVIKKIMAKNNIQLEKATLYPSIDELEKQNIFTPAKKKKILALAGYRNHAFHAEWDKLDIKDVGELVRGVRKLIEDYLQ